MYLLCIVLLWNHQEKIGDYLSSSRDHKAVGRRPFDKMATLLAYLGPPEHKPVDSQYVLYRGLSLSILLIIILFKFVVFFVRKMEFDRYVID